MIEKRIAEKYPRIGQRYFSDELDKDVVGKLTLDNGRSMYHVDYCKREDGIVSKTTIKRGVGKFAIKLPDDWEMPATTSGKIYRFTILLKILEKLILIFYGQKCKKYCTCVQ